LGEAWLISFLFAIADPRRTPVLKLFAERERAMWKEFKAFAVKGSVIDMAVGVIIGKNGLKFEKGA
jgi:hypothetical protein